MTSLRIAAWCAVALAAATAPAQAQGRYSLPAADRDASGTVTRAEYQDSRAAFILKADTNRDGVISRAEWDAFATAVRRELDLGAVRGAELVGQGRWWTALDANRDNVVTLPEIHATTAANFARYDTDRNGLISRAESQAVRKQVEASLR
jgi:hypothetical protein